MNIEEAIKQLKKHKAEIDKEYISARYSKAIETLLTAYEKEKEKNKELEETKNKLVRYIAIKEGKDYEQICREFEI